MYWCADKQCPGIEKLSSPVHEIVTRSCTCKKWAIFDIFSCTCTSCLVLILFVLYLYFLSCTSCLVLLLLVLYLYFLSWTSTSCLVLLHQEMPCNLSTFPCTILGTYISKFWPILEPIFPSFDPFWAIFDHFGPWWSFLGSFCDKNHHLEPQEVVFAVLCLVLSCNCTCTCTCTPIFGSALKLRAHLVQSGILFCGTTDVLH